MSMTQAVGSVLRQYATFTGRARRSEYWWFYLFTIVAGVAASLVDAVLGLAVENELGVVNLLVSLAFLVPTLAVGARRLHDTGRTGWWLLLPVVPGVLAFVLAIPAMLFGVFAAANGAMDAMAFVTIAIAVLCFVCMLVAGIVLIVFLCQNSQPGPNKYGPSPKPPLAPWGYSPPAGGYYAPQG